MHHVRHAQQAALEFHLFDLLAETGPLQLGIVELLPQALLLSLDVKQSSLRLRQLIGQRLYLLPIVLGKMHVHGVAESGFLQIVATLCRRRRTDLSVSTIQSDHNRLTFDFLEERCHLVLHSDEVIHLYVIVDVLQGMDFLKVGNFGKSGKRAERAVSHSLP